MTDRNGTPRRDILGDHRVVDVEAASDHPAAVRVHHRRSRPMIAARCTSEPRPPPQDVAASGPAGGIYSNDLFAEDRGEATVFLPFDLTFRATGRIDPRIIPAVELATTTHAGPHRDIDRSYGALATFVAHHAISIDGPIRQYYLLDHHTTTDRSQWRTQIGWSIFHTAQPS